MRVQRLGMILSSVLWLVAGCVCETYDDGSWDDRGSSSGYGGSYDSTRWNDVPSFGDTNVGGGAGQACRSDRTCPVGCYCDDGRCIESGTCFAESQCGPGMSCETRRMTCVPEGREPSWDSLGGSDAGAVPVSVDAGMATTSCPAEGCDASVSVYNEGSRMRDGGIDTEPARTEDHCVRDADCGGGLCDDTGMCHAPCTGDADCGTGDRCREGYCWLDSSPAVECHASEDCAEPSICINATCHGLCELDADCENPRDFCDHGVCRPDWRASSECVRNSDCQADLQCVEGACRAPCWSDSDCDGCSCVQGFCAF